MSKKIPITPGLVEEFFKRVKKRPGDDCWQWLGVIGERGVGHFTVNKRKVLATHVAWEMANGKPLPKDAVVAHECRGNRGCVRPDHLVVMTRLQARRRKGATPYLHLSNDFPGGLLTGEQLEAVRELVAPSPSDTVRLLKAMAGRLDALQQSVTGLTSSIEALATKDEMRQLAAKLEHEVAAAVSRETSEASASTAADVLRVAEADAQPPPAQKPEPGRWLMTADVPEPSWPQPKLADVLAAEFERAVGRPPPDDSAALEHAFDLALAEAGGNANGALITLRSWFGAYAESMPREPAAADFFGWCARLTEDRSAAR